MATHAPVRAALLGSGLFATGAYLPSLKGVTNLTINTVWSRSEKSARNLETKAQELGFPAFDTQFGPEGLDAVLANKDINAVILVLPITAQPDIIRRAWKAGKHVLSEKPLGRDIAEAKALVDEYEKEYKPKGLVWRVAENWAHEPFLHKAHDLLANPAVGPVLYWRMHMEAVIQDGESWHATTWRTIPEYQGGFILDGGVHWAAMLRTVLPKYCKPASIIAVKSLHRSHILPHDTLVGLVHPDPSATSEPTGLPTTIKADIEAKDMPVEPGKSTPHGSFILSWAAPDTPQSGRCPNELYVVAEHGTLRILNTGAKWNVTLTPTDKSGLEAVHVEGPATGVEQELIDFGAAVEAAIHGHKDDKPNLADPALALWDLSFIEAALNSDGQKVEIEKK